MYVRKVGRGDLARAEDCERVYFFRCAFLEDAFGPLRIFKASDKRAAATDGEIGMALIRAGLADRKRLPGAAGIVRPLPCHRIDAPRVALRHARQLNEGRGGFDVARGYLARAGRIERP